MQNSARLFAAGVGGVPPPTATGEPTAPSAGDHIMNASDFKAIPKDGGQSELTPPAGGLKSGQGKRSAEEMAYEDKVFLAERKAELKEHGAFDHMPCDNEADMAEWCKGKVRVLSAIVTKISAKLTSFKRRKDTSLTDRNLLDELVDVQSTAAAFQQLYSELSSDSPFGSQLNEAVLSLVNLGYEFSRLVHVKRVRAIIMDDLRFGYWAQWSIYLLHHQIKSHRSALCKSVRCKPGQVNQVYVYGIRYTVYGI